jgi:hypothetical protein
MLRCIALQKAQHHDPDRSARAAMPTFAAASGLPSDKLP